MISWRLVVVAGVISLCAVSATAQEGVGRRAGEKVDQAVERLREEAKDVAGQMREGFVDARAMVERMGVTGRVYVRLHWDKALQDASISVDVAKDGRTTLRGTVASEEAKTKAAQLADDTIGVQRVVDELKVEASSAR